MKKLRLIAALGLMSAMALAHASNINVIRVVAPVNPYPGKWAASAPVYGEWQASGAPFSCAGWTPAPNQITKGTTYTQTSTCQQNYQRLVTLTEVNDISGIKRNTGVTQTESKTGTAQSTRQAIGTRDCAYDAVKTYWQTYRYTREFSRYVIINGEYTFFGDYDNPQLDSVTIKGIQYYRGAQRYIYSEGRATDLRYELCRLN